MKNVLFATTALVAFAGAASAGSHGGGVDVSWTGDFELGYNQEVKGGIFSTASIGVDVTVDFGDSVTAMTSFSFGSGGTSSGYVEFGYDPGSSLSAMIRYGDLNDEGASERYFSKVSGTAVKAENHDGGTDIVAEVTFGSFSFAAGCQVAAGVCSGNNFGVGATFGSIELGVAYDDTSGGQSEMTGVSADATFGAISVGVSYATGTTTYSAKTGADPDDTDPANPGAGGVLTTVTGPETAIGVSLGYEVSDALSFEVFYAQNSVLGNQYGVSASYSAGALGIDVYYEQNRAFWMTPGAGGVDADGDGYYTVAGTAAFASTQQYGVDVSYDVSDQLTFLAGVRVAPVIASNNSAVNLGTGTGYYAGVEYDVNDNISATLSYSNYDAISGPEFNQGITAMITASF